MYDIVCAQIKLRIHKFKYFGNLHEGRVVKLLCKVLLFAIITGACIKFSAVFSAAL